MHNQLSEFEQLLERGYLFELLDNHKLGSADSTTARVRQYFEEEQRSREKKLQERLKRPLIKSPAFWRGFLKGFTSPMLLFNRRALSQKPLVADESVLERAISYEELFEKAFIDYINEHKIDLHAIASVCGIQLEQFCFIKKNKCKISRAIL